MIEVVSGGGGGGLVLLYIDGYESKPAIWILAIVEKSQQTSNFCYFATFCFHVLA